MYYPMDPTMVLLLPAIALALYAQFKVTSTYNSMSQVKAKSGLSASDAGRKLLDSAGLSNVAIEATPGSLTDHYDPRTKTLRLSEGVYHSDSIAALGVVAHEVGHAVQDSKAYIPLKIRGGLVPAANIGSNLAIPLFFIGLIASSPKLMDAGIVLFSIAVAFTVITLPVEFNASHRAIAMLSDSNLLKDYELPKAKRVLDAAALTYIAAMAMAVLNLVRLIALRGSRED